MWYICGVGVKAIMSDELHLAPIVVRCKRIRKHPSANQPRLTTASCSFEFIGRSAITCFTCLSSTVTNVYIDAHLTRAESSETAYIDRISVVVKDLRLKDKDKDEDLKIGQHWFWVTVGRMTLNKTIQGGPKGKPQTFVHIFAKLLTDFQFFSPAHSAEML